MLEKGEEVNDKVVKAITQKANRKYKKQYPVCGDEHFNESDVRWILEIVYERLGGKIAD